MLLLLFCYKDQQKDKAKMYVCKMNDFEWLWCDWLEISLLIKTSKSVQGVSVQCRNQRSTKLEPVKFASKLLVMKPFNCSVCEKSYFHKDSLKRHEKEMHWYLK